jgi:hypothetical protein
MDGSGRGLICGTENNHLKYLSRHQAPGAGFEPGIFRVRSSANHSTSTFDRAYVCVYCHVFW